MISREEAQKDTKRFQSSELLRLLSLFVAINLVGKISREEARRDTKKSDLFPFASFAPFCGHQIFSAPFAGTVLVPKLCDFLSPLTAVSFSVH